MTSATLPASGRWLPDPFLTTNGDNPFARFVAHLPDVAAVALEVAIDLVLAAQGIDLARTEWLRPLGRGAYEFRVRHDATEIARMFDGGSIAAGSPKRDMLLRLFVHFHGDRRILLLNGYDKGADTSQRRQQRDFAYARRLLRQFKTGAP
jgi:hypothetical protein